MNAPWFSASELSPELRAKAELCDECVTPIACYARREVEDGYCLRVARAKLAEDANSQEQPQTKEETS